MDSDEAPTPRRAYGRCTNASASWSSRSSCGSGRITNALGLLARLVSGVSQPSAPHRPRTEPRLAVEAAVFSNGRSLCMTHASPTASQRTVQPATPGADQAACSASPRAKDECTRPLRVT